MGNVALLPRMSLGAARADYVVKLGAADKGSGLGLARL